MGDNKRKHTAVIGNECVLPYGNLINQNIFYGWVNETLLTFYSNSANFLIRESQNFFRTPNLFLYGIKTTLPHPPPFFSS